MGEKTNIGGDSPTNDAKNLINICEPTMVTVTIEGISDLLFHRWSNEGVEAKSKAAKGSAAKLTDDLESFVYRNDQGFICLPGEYLRQSVIHAAKYKQDPRSKRKSAMDLYKAGIICTTHLASLDIKDWDYEDRRRVTIQRSAITRSRPAIKAGWRATFDFLINIPEYIGINDFIEVMANAGRLVGLGDFRPTFGRFQIKNYD